MQESHDQRLRPASQSRPATGACRGGSARPEKIFRDPVHDFITVSHPVLVELVDTPEFQRLRRLRQLGCAFGTYHGAEHSRFGHSLGTLHVMGKVLQRLSRCAGIRLEPELELLAQAAALLHDVGHGPFSHGLERVLTPGVGHEEWTRAIIAGPTRVHDVLESWQQGLAEQVVGVLDGRLPPQLGWLHTLVSSQLDVDRMDYLLRDALYTGAFYGRFDLERLINTLTLAEGQVAFTYKGLPTAEEYVLARHYMYWQVYFHKTTRAQDLVLRSLWQRVRELVEAGAHDVEGPLTPPSLRPFLAAEAPSLQAYLAVDDHDVMYAIKLWQRHPDPIVADMAGRFLHRRLLKPVWRQPPADLEPERLERARRLVGRRGWDPRYYCLLDRTADIAYDLYTEPRARGGSPPILAVDPRGRLRELSAVSDVIRALASRGRTAVNLYVPAEVRDEVAAEVGE